MKSFNVNFAIICVHSTFDIETWKCASDVDDSGDKYLEDMTGEYCPENPFGNQDEDGDKVSGWKLR